MSNVVHNTRSYAKFLEEMNSHIPNRDAAVLSRCAQELYDKKQHFKDSSVFWDIAHHILDAMQAEKFKDPFISLVFYHQAAKEVLKNHDSLIQEGSLTAQKLQSARQMLQWAKSLSDRSMEIFKANFSRGAASLNSADIEMKHSLDELALRIWYLMSPLPPIRDLCAMPPKEYYPNQWD